ncbi:MAG: hypothetical protein H7335_14940 [Massilia sp.]|nr:hypothetical protein [Massilia sp.]
MIILLVNPILSAGMAINWQCFSPCTGSNIGVNNFPADGAFSLRAPYNPGLPLHGGLEHSQHAINRLTPAPEWFGAGVTLALRSTL